MNASSLSRPAADGAPLIGAPALAEPAIRLWFSWAGRLQPWAWVLAAVLALCGLAVGLIIAPADHQQGDAYRILFVHVPAAWMSLLLYLGLATAAGAGLILESPVAALLARAIAPTGALMTFLALWTGSLWGRPAWGAWWVWDARLTSELLLLFLYVGFIALQAAIDDPRRADRAGAVLALVGVIDVPVIHYSVQWWSTLHQGASVNLMRSASMDAQMLSGLALMALAFLAWCAGSTLHRLRTLVMEREAGAAWLRPHLEARP